MVKKGEWVRWTSPITGVPNVACVKEDLTDNSRNFRSLYFPLLDHHNGFSVDLEEVEVITEEEAKSNLVKQWLKGTAFPWDFLTK